VKKITRMITLIDSPNWNKNGKNVSFVNKTKQSEREMGEFGEV
jgi:hypothetical protein